ncbi:Gramicidin S synthase 2 [Roseimaritima multifibrata]|uniref:Gramicidin S synthase 2 n=1 Tax=Roseimaritima multifibrata TaxID=1930274 RepID=A0A517MHP3_9BACT|nr:condensation domain-containing protein [Roseimaritima multifibrata]QDS94404.1 Gramicidin S synthase 2 [Roseimaritima multifibrata]
MNDPSSIHEEATASLREQISLAVRARLVEFLGFESLDEIAANDSFADLGTDSSQAVEFKLILEEMYGLSLKTSILFDFPTVDRLVDHLASALSDGDPIAPERSSAMIRSVRQSRSVNDGDSFPLSQTQLGLWFIGQSRASDSSFHVPVLFRLVTEEFHPTIFNEALRKTVQRHPAVRVTITTDSETGQLQQTVQPSTAVPGIAELAVSGDIFKTFRSVMQEPMNLEDQPPVQSFHGCDDEGTHWVLLKFHHIVIDGLSATPLVAELWNNYLSADAKPATSTNLPLDTGFLDYLNWEADYLASQRAARDSEFWKTTLAGADGDTGLPTDAAEQAKSETACEVDCIAMELPTKLNNAVDRLACTTQTPASSVLLALYFVLLNRIGHHEDLAVTSPISGRPGGIRGPFRDNVGCFINLIVTRCQVDETQSFADFAKMVSGHFLAAIEHGQLPFAQQLQAASLNLIGEHERSVFPYSFTYQNIFEAWGKDSKWQQFAAPELSLFQEVEDEFTLEVYERTNGRSLNWKFQTDRFSRTTIESWADSFLHLLEQVACDPERSLENLSAVPDHQAEAFREHFDRRNEACTTPNSVVDWIDKAAEKSPEKVALAGTDGEWTFAALIAHSHHIADHLRTNGYGQGSILAIPARRDSRTIATLLGILRSGAAYVPIDPNEPETRTQSHLANIGAVPLQTALIPIEKSVPANAVAPPDDSTPIAYILFTSGTSGQPKAAAIQHSALVNLCHALIAEYQLTPADTVLQFASLTFDMSVEEIFPILCAGGQLVVRTEEDLSTAKLSALIDQHGITVLNLPPSYHQALRSNPPQMRKFYQSVRIVAFGGDQCPLRTIAEVADLGPRVFNAYGPTETTVNATISSLSIDGHSNCHRVHIGRPISGVGIGIFDSKGRLVPEGAIGELIVFGAGVCDGYLDQISDAFRHQLFPGDDATTPAYRTGDLARITRTASHDKQPNIEWIGRRDFQINLRGHRIEPEEIESQLLRHPAVTAAGVCIDDSERLIALLVCEPGSTEYLTSWLADRLPTKMLPQFFCEVDNLPTTNRGKLDRRLMRNQIPRTLSSPNDPLTQKDQPRPGQWKEVSKIVAEILEVDVIEPADRFIDLGGHSLLAIICITKLSDAFEIELNLRDFLAAENIGDLATIVERKRHSQWKRGPAAGPLDVDPASSNNRRPNIAPLSPQQERLWFLDELGEGAAYVIPAIAFVEGPIDTARLRQAIETIADRHESLRTTFQVIAGRPQQVIHPAANLSIDERTFVDSTTARTWIDEKASIPFDLQNGPLYRISLARFAEDRSLLLINFHHIITDGWSMRIFVDELKNIYESGDQSKLPEIAGTYADYAHRLSQRIRSEQSTKYWSQHLAGLQDAELWPDRKANRRLSSNGDVVTTTVPKGVNDGITGLCKESGITKAAFWLACLRFVLHRRSAGDDFAIGMPTATRDAPGVTNLIGFFVGTLVLRLKTPTEIKDQTLGKWLQHAQSRLNSALSNQDCTVDEILALVAPERRLDRSPLFQVLLSYAAEPMIPFQLGEAVIHPVMPTVDRAKFEWTVSVAEQNDGTATVALEYATDLFDRETADNAVRQLADVASQWTNEPNRHLACRSSLLPSDLPVVRHQSAATDSLNPTLTFRDAFHKQVQRQPNAPAVEFDDRIHTYQEIDERTQPTHANLPHGLTLTRLDPDRTSDTLTQCIAALKAERPFLFSRFPVAVSSLPMGTACVALSSGTLGASKGIVISQASLDLHNVSFADRLKLTPDDRVCQYASPEFDLYLEEVLPTLRSGATLCVAPEACRLAPDRFTQWLTQSQITLIDLPTAFFHRWVEWLLAQPFNEHWNLRAVVVGGEKLQSDVARAFVKRYPRVELHNTYGPTEATIICTAHLVDALEASSDVSIGRPFAKADLCVVAPDGSPAVTGAAGELVIAGAGLATGYLIDGQVSQTGGFRPHPFAPERASFWTGDRVRKRADGSFQFLGRLDRQVKIRGVRLQPDDVAARISENANVQSVAVVVDEKTNDPRLVAAVVLHPEVSVDSARSEIATDLPPSFRPACWLFCDSIPLTDRGKIDQREIIRRSTEPAPCFGSRQMQNASEQEIARIWSELLGHNQFGPDDDFFLVGGHSLLAAILVREIEKQFQVPLELPSIFAHPTISQMGRLLDCKRKEFTRATSTDGLRGLPAKTSAPQAISVLFPGLPGIGELYDPLAEHLRFDSDYLSLSIPGLTEKSVPRSITELAETWSRWLQPKVVNSELPIRFIAHSFSASVLVEVLRRNSIWLRRCEQIVILDAMPHQPYTLNSQKGNRAESQPEPLVGEFRESLSELLSSAPLRADTPLPATAHVVVARQSETWMRPSAWEAYFKHVTSIVCEGDHRSITGPPHCHAWLARIFPTINPPVHSL